MRFFLIDKIKDWQVGKSAVAIKNIALSEDFFDDHFPRRPVMPGVLILEGLAQLSGLLLEDLDVVREAYAGVGSCTTRTEGEWAAVSIHRGLP